MNLFIENHTNQSLNDKHKKIISDVVRFALELEDIHSEPEIGVHIVDNEEIKKLNKKFRSVDKETDVLSFPMIEFGDEPKNVLIKKNILLGDIVISWPKVCEQAKEYGHTIEREIGFLTAHGILHLLGYDHISSEDEKIMFDKQEVILAKIGLIR